MNEPIHAGGEMDRREVERTLRHVRRWRFHCLVRHLCRKKGPLAWWKTHQAWQRVCRRHGKVRALWVSANSLVALVGFVLAGGMLCGCKERPAESAQIQLKHEDSKEVVPPTWPPHGYQRVVAHRFQIPEENPESFSLIQGGKVDLELLKKLSVAAAELTPAQTSTLLTGTFSDRRESMAACYDPHHLFLFLDGEGKVLNAIEICFSCTAISTLPELAEDQWKHHDFRMLARLCEEIG
ncbi:MAG TPA: hypothetical protein VGE67_06150, partial [Haloferula sp.]